MGVTNWKQGTQERKQWKEIIEQAKTLKELYSWKKKKKKKNKKKKKKKKKRKKKKKKKKILHHSDWFRFQCFFTN